MGDYTIKEIKSIKIYDIDRNIVEEINPSECTSLSTIEEKELCGLFSIFAEILREPIKKLEEE